MLRFATLIFTLGVLMGCTNIQETPLVMDSDVWVMESARVDSILREFRGEEGVPTIEFFNDGGVQGTTHCNQFQGQYTTKNNKESSQIDITIQDITKTQCPYQVMESDYIHKLELSTNYKMEENRLILTDENGENLLIFIPASVIQKRLNMGRESNKS